MKRRSLLVRALCALVTVFCLAVATTGWFDRLDLGASDALLRISPAPKPSPEIVVVAIDGRAIHEYGPIPWPPRLMARLVRAIDSYHPRVIGLDFIYTGEGEMPGQVQSESRPGIDELAEAVRSSGHLIAGTFFDFDQVPESKIPEATSLQREQREKHLRFVAGKPVNVRDLPIAAGTGIHLNAPKVSAGAAGAAHLNLLPGADGIMRFVPLVARYRDDLYTSFDVRLASAFSGSDELDVLIGDGRIDGIEMGSRRIVTDESGRLLLHFAGPAGTFRYVAASDILEGRTQPESLRGALALVGVTAAAAGDLWVTPNAHFMPGVEIHANAVNNMLQGSFVVYNATTRILTYTVIVVLGVLGFVFLPRVRQAGPKGIAIIAAAAAVVLLLGYWITFVAFGFAIGITAPLLQLGLISAGTLCLNYGTEERYRKQIEQSFRYYLDPNVINELLLDPQRLRLGGERRELSVLFCDIRGFTTLSEKLSPEAIVRILNLVFTTMSDVVTASGGLVDKFVGDQIMAFWGAPVARAHHAELACEAALGMRREFPRIRERCAADLQGLHLDCGIGLNSGPMIVGNIGAERRFSYTVIGDSVNIAARLQALNKVYGSAILVGPETYEDAISHYWFRIVDEVRVRGRDQAIAIYELIGKRGESDPDTEWLSEFQHGVEAFLRQEWSKALGFFESARARNAADPATAYYLGRVKEMMAAPSAPRAHATYTSS
jgi:adenylate cyclase